MHSNTFELPRASVRNKYGLFRLELQQVPIETILEGISDSIFIMNKDLQIIFFNRAAEQFTGMVREDAIGQRCSKVFRSSLCEKNCIMQKTFATKIPILNKQALMINAQGQKIPVNISTILLRNRYNEVIGCVEIIRNPRSGDLPLEKSSAPVPYEELITRNPSMGRIIKKLPEISAGWKNVIIKGERGTGREVLARAIHALSFHRKKPFISLDYATQSNTIFDLIENHSGFYSDIYNDNPGCLPLPGGSTLFLNDISESGRAFQKQLAGILLEKKNAVDSRSGSFLAVRVIASTRRNLFPLVTSGEFHRELYHRINGISIEVPPLRDRKEDIPLLIDHFISSSNFLAHKSFAGVNQEAMDLLMAYNFPENISELKQIISHAYALCPEGFISPCHLTDTIRRTVAPETEAVDMEAAVRNAEAQTIIAALKKNNYNRMAAARELGIHKSTFFRKIKHLGIVLPQIDGRFRSIL